MRPLSDEQRAGPVVWGGIIAATCLLLVLLEHMLWLAIPFLFGTILYYILLDPMMRMIRAGVGRDVAALTVGGGFFAFLALAGVALASWSAAPGTSWQELIARYLDGGVVFVRNTMALLEAKFPILEQMHLTAVVNTRFKTFTDNFAQQQTLYLLHEVDQTARRYFSGLINKLTMIASAASWWSSWRRRTPRSIP